MSPEKDSSLFASLRMPRAQSRASDMLSVQQPLGDFVQMQDVGVAPEMLLFNKIPGDANSALP